MSEQIPQSQIPYPPQQPLPPQGSYPSSSDNLWHPPSEGQPLYQGAPKWETPNWPSQGYQQQPTQPPQSPKKSSKKIYWIIGASVIVVMVAAISGVFNTPNSNQSNTQTANQGTQQQATQPAATQVPTKQPTTADTPVPTTVGLTNISPTHGDPHLGGQISDFYGKYGTPSNTNGTDAYWDLNQDGSLMLDVRDTGGGKVGYLSLSAPDSWSKQKIEDFFISNFAPPGAVINKQANDWWASQGGDPFDPIAYDSDIGKFFLHISDGSGYMNTV